MSGKNRYTKIYLIVLEDIGTDREHVHIIHGCKRHHGSCQCNFTDTICNRIGRAEDTRVFNSIDKTGKSNLIQYFGKNPIRVYNITFTHNMKLQTSSILTQKPIVSSEAEGDKYVFRPGRHSNEPGSSRTNQAIHYQFANLPGQYESQRSSCNSKRFSFQD